jgi:hypothetical protein
MGLVVVFFVIGAIAWRRKGWASALPASGAGPVPGPVC